MPRVTFVEHDGTRHGVDAGDGLSVMEAAIDNGVPGIDADCGGNCACATCHIYVAPEWREATGAMTEMETAMLDFAENVQAGSRLACQIVMAPALDGLVVSMPASQH